jgi:hypothetical protein
MKMQLTLLFSPLLTAISKLMAAPSFCLPGYVDIRNSSANKPEMIPSDAKAIVVFANRSQSFKALVKKNSHAKYK